jgi:hypothetical protein
VRPRLWSNLLAFARLHPLNIAACRWSLLKRFTRSMMQILVWILIIVLVVLHQDYWQWEESGLVLGFLPYCLAYHAGISLAAAAVWWLATRFCWPHLPGEAARGGQEQSR